MLNIHVNLNGVEDRPSHGRVDIAAAVAEQAWERTIGAKALDAAADNLLDEEHVRDQLADEVHRLSTGHYTAAHHAARLGFALARTADDASDRGWPGWLTAAEEWLAIQGCDCGAAALSLLDVRLPKHTNERPARALPTARSHRLSTDNSVG